MAYPTDLPEYAPFITPITLQAFQHTQRHRQMEEDIVALATKVGTDASADPNSLESRLSDVEDWMVLVDAQLGALDDRIDDVIDGTEALTTPQILNFGSAQHDHEDAAGGGTLDGDALPSTDGLLRAVHYYTYDGTDVFIDGVDQNNGDNTVDWSKPTGLKFVIVVVIGGGGSGASCVAGAGGNINLPGGGAGGGGSRKKIAAASLGSTEVVTVGAGGAAPATGANGGNQGGTSSFGSHLQATGGGGGSVDSNHTHNVCAGLANGGVGSLGDLNVSGGKSTPSTADIAGSRGVACSGGMAAWGFGAGGAGARVSSASAAGDAGLSYGGGGSGAINAAAGVARSGGAGAAGIVIIYEYY